VSYFRDAPRFRVWLIAFLVDLIVEFDVYEKHTTLLSFNNRSHSCGKQVQLPFGDRPEFAAPSMCSEVDMEGFMLIRIRPHDENANLEKRP